MARHWILVRPSVLSHAERLVLLQGETTIVVLTLAYDLNLVLEVGDVAGNLVNTLVQAAHIDSLLLFCNFGLVILDLLLQLLLQLIYLFFLLLVFEHDGRDVLLDKLLFRGVCGCDRAYTHSRLLLGTIYT